MISVARSRRRAALKDVGDIAANYKRRAPAVRSLNLASDVSYDELIATMSVVRSAGQSKLCDVEDCCVAAVLSGRVCGVVVVC